MLNYKLLINDILTYGDKTQDRTGVGTLSKFGTTMRWNLQDGFPAVTTKRLAWKAVVSELLWFMSGSTNVEELRDRLVTDERPFPKTIWDDNYENQGKALGYTDGELGPVYGAQWRGTTNGIDQLENVIMGLQNDLENGTRGRRHLVNAWNVADLDKMTLPPCHMMFQFYLNSKNELSLQWYQRSVDVFLGLPFNIASYALLTHIVANIIGAEVGELIFVGGDTHIYTNHVDACNELLHNSPRELPTLVMPKYRSLQPYIAADIDQFKLEGYNPHATIKAPMAI